MALPPAPVTTPIIGPDGRVSPVWERWLQLLVAGVASGGASGFTVAGAGLTSSGSTVNAVANADGSIVVNANDIQVGTLADDAQHGEMGGGSLHGLAVAGGDAGFLSGSDKTKLDNTTNTNSGDVTLAAVGSSPNANGASLSGQQLTLQPASASHPGVVTTGAQTFAGAKNFSGNVGLGQSSFAGYQADLGNTLANTKLALYNAGGNPAGIGVQSGNIRFHGTSGAGTFTWHQSAAGSAVATLNWANGDFSCGAITSGGVAVPTISSTSTLTNKTLTSPTINGAALSGNISGNPAFTGSPTFAAPTLTALGAAGANWTKGAGDDAPRYYKDAFGRVHLMGSVTAGAGAGSPTWAAANGLPAGYRPAALRYLPCLQYSVNDDTWYAASAFIASTGQVSFIAANNTAFTDGDIFYLDGVSFLAEA